MIAAITRANTAKTMSCFRSMGAITVVSTPERRHADIGGRWQEQPERHENEDDDGGDGDAHGHGVTGSRPGYPPAGSAGIRIQCPRQMVRAHCAGSHRDPPARYPLRRADLNNHGGGCSQPSRGSTPFLDQRPCAVARQARRSASFIGNPRSDFPATLMWCGKDLLATPRPHIWFAELVVGDHEVCSVTNCY